MSEALKQKYAHLTLEHLETLDEGQLGDLEYQITQERKVLEMQLEALEAAGGVSRDMANSYTEYLPKEMALESFTGQLTRTNYDMSVESLSTALKIVVAVGVIAGLGTLVWLFTRSSNRERKEINDKGLEATERLRGAVGKAEDLLKDTWGEAYAKASASGPSNNVKKFVNEGKLDLVRTALWLDINSAQNNNDTLIANMNLAQGKFPDLFVPFFEGAFAREMNSDKSVWTEDYEHTQLGYLKTNFSRERYMHSVEVRTYLSDETGEKKHAEIQKRYEDNLAKAKKKEEAEAVMQAAQGGLDAYTWTKLLAMTVGRTDMKGGTAVTNIYSKAEFTINADFKELLIPAIDAAVKFSKSGREEDLKNLHQLMERRPVDRVMKAYNAIGDTITSIMADGGARSKAKFDDADGAMRVFMEWCESTPVMNDFNVASVRGYLLTGDYKIEAPNYTKVLKDIDKILEVGKELPAQEKRLKEVETLPKEVSDALNVYIEATKQNLKAVDYLAALINLEVVTFNRMLKFANRQLAGSVQTTIDSLDAVLVDPDVGPKMKSVITKAIRQIRDSIKP